MYVMSKHLRIMSLYMYINEFSPKRFHISRGTSESEIVFLVIKQCLQAVRHMLVVRRLHQNVTVIRISQLISRKCAE